MTPFKALLVYPNLQLVNLLPSNIAILSAYLKSHGIEVKLFDATLYHTAEKSIDEIRVENMQLRSFDLLERGITYKESDVFEDFKALVREYMPEVIAVSATDATYDLGIALVSVLEDCDSHIIFGGTFPTFAPEKVIRNARVDSVCVGEGEEALFELCEKLRDGKNISDIRNLWVKIDGKIFKNSIRPPVDIDTLPYEDFSIFEEKRFFRPMQGKIFKMIPFSIDRGCPFKCSFCAAPLNRKLYRDSGTGNYFRTKSIAGIIAELKFQVEKYHAEYIFFNSETFFARNDKDIEYFAKAYSREVNLPFWCQTRVETITEDRIRTLEDMHCDRISIGIEHGNEEFRKSLLRKDFTNRQAIDAFNLLAKSKIPITVNNMIGFPDETRELAFDTIMLNRKIQADSISTFFFVPYHGTPLRQYSIEKGYLNPEIQPGTPMISTILHMPQFPPGQIKGLMRTLPLYVKMPKSCFKKIKIAEQLTPEGDAAFEELRKIYFQEYFK